MCETENLQLQTRHIDCIEAAVKNILAGDTSKARQLIQERYPFHPIRTTSRKYSTEQKMKQFVSDGFIDRYFGTRLVNPGILRVLSFYFPDIFPYQPHWKMSECHIAYWELIPTIDHIVPVALGGKDLPENWATTSMLHNSIKSNWTLPQVGWTLHPAGKLSDWDGMSAGFLSLAAADPRLLDVDWIREWYRATKKFL